MVKVFARSLHHLQQFIANLISLANALTPNLKKVSHRIRPHCQLSSLLVHWSYGEKINANHCNSEDVCMLAEHRRLSLQNVLQTEQ